MATKIDNDISRIEKGAITSTNSDSKKDDSFWTSTTVVVTFQKVIAEVIGTYFVIFIGCGSVVVNKLYDGTVTFPGICVTWGLIVMVMVYSVGHISGAHFNPAVTITFAIFRRFPWWEVPLYIAAQLMGSVLGSCTLSLIFEVTSEAYFGTVPAGSNLQSFVLEFIISFLLMFVISGVATDNRSVGELAGIAVGMTITLNVFVAGVLSLDWFLANLGSSASRCYCFLSGANLVGIVKASGDAFALPSLLIPISGASMNPARSIGPAIVNHVYKGLWVYIIGPPCGTIAGGFTYNLIRFTDRPLRELTKSSSFLRSLSKS
ncbi:hypothetical protein TEA_022005 [Camellia sinensis var. sinensis]|uniref:Aquaporin NIP-type n=1 Tax=Camellia sinensis var. sinensis TaxID=542762 RepID=A0A4S4ELB0_CAMSN|nr:hypothetical protein TEA_022005 [Camellia sinensis var. sinensis]